MPLIVALVGLGALAFMLLRKPADPSLGLSSNPIPLTVDASTRALNLRAGLYYRIEGTFDANGEGWTFFPENPLIVMYAWPDTADPRAFVVHAQEVGGTVVHMQGQGAPDSGAVFVSVV